jgi:hypothetical protein
MGTMDTKRKLSATMKQRAIDEACPKCGRKSAMKVYRDGYGGTTVYCRWILEGKCDHQVTRFRWDGER